MMAAVALDPIDAARAGLYRLLAASLSEPPGPELLARLRALDGEAGALGDALRGVAAAAEMPVEAAQREYNTLFVGVGRGELMPYASFYLTGFLHQRPLARMRETMAAYGLEPAADRSDPEDHIATMCEVMAHAIEVLDGGGETLAQQRSMFIRHLEPWAGRFFADLEDAASARLYRPIGALGRVLVQIDRDAFHLED